MVDNYNNLNQGQGYPDTERPVYVDHPVPPQPKSGKASAALVLGICSLLLGCTGIFSLICAIIGLVLCSQAKQEMSQESGIGKAGKVLNIIGLIWGILGILFWLILIFFGEWEFTYY